MGDSDAAMKRRLATMEAALSEVQAALAEAQGEIAELQGRNDGTLSAMAAAVLFLHPCCHTNGVDRLLLCACHALGSPARQKPQRSSKTAAARLAMHLL